MKSIDFSILLRFGITAGVGSYIGSLIISYLGQDVIFYDYTAFNHIFKVEAFNFIIGILMLIFALIELIPSFKSKSFDKKWLPLGGFISGFFGGLSVERNLPAVSELRAPTLGRAISQFKSFGSSSKHAEIGPESFGIVVCRFVGTVPDILGLVWPSFRPKSGSKSKISGRILKSFRGPFSSAEAGCC